MAPDAFVGNRMQRNFCRTQREPRRIDMKVKLFSAAIIVATSMQGTPAYAANALTGDQLKAISDFAQAICPTVPMESSRKERSAKIEAEFPKLLSLLGNVDGELKWEEIKTRGVLQTKLHEVIENTNDCRLDVLNFVKGYIDKERRGRVDWVPIFSPWKIALVSRCKKEVSCELPSRRDFIRYEYGSSTFNLGSRGSAQVTYPRNIGRVVSVFNGNDVSLKFSYVAIPDDEFENVKVCFCLSRDE